MKRNSQRGVALVITLIMLGLVTFMAVVFLAISRRERASVTVSGDIINARLMADAALARAQSEIAARIMASSNLFNYDLIVSTNYYATNGFVSGSTNASNVNYERRNNGSIMRANPGNANDLKDWVQNIANLQYDPRPPVFVARAKTGLFTNDFRFFVDLNRNGYFEPTGLYATNEPNARNVRYTNFFVGDPQWIGVLERPDRPHSESNRFVGRYAFAILPAGKSLDINYVHNNAKRLSLDGSQDGFLRNQGVGSWEINLAGFLAGLNTNANAWGPLNNFDATYLFRTNLNFTSTGRAFEDARMLLRYRYNRQLNNLLPASAMLNLGPAPNAFTTNGIDYFSDWRMSQADMQNKFNVPWSASQNPQGYYDIQELFDPTKTSTDFVFRLTNNAGLPALSSSWYNRYTFYRLLAQLGTDSSVQESNRLYLDDYQLHPTKRLHLNYVNAGRNGQTNFLRWNPQSFFMQAADRLLRSGLDRYILTNNEPILTSVAGYRYIRTNRTGNNLIPGTNFMVGFTPVRPLLSVTNIQIWHRNSSLSQPQLPYYLTNNEYSSTLHRLLQVAANLYDATTVRRLSPSSTNDYPSVFRPAFMRTDTNLIICGFTEDPSTNHFDRVQTIEEAVGIVASPLGPLQLNTVYTNRVIAGVSFVIGAKKGYPNFNKFVVQTTAEVSRRLEIMKTAPNRPLAATNQMYEIGVSNRFGVEGWNSYSNVFNRGVEVRVAGRSWFGLHHRLEGEAGNRPPAYLTNAFFDRRLALNQWPGTAQGLANSFIVPVDTSLTRIPTMAYQTSKGLLVATNEFERSFRVPQLWLWMTNRLQYTVIETNAPGGPRLVDYVSLDNLVTYIDVTQGLRGSTNSGGGGIFDDAGGALSPGDMWIPDRLGGQAVESPSKGIVNQIAVSKGVPYTGAGTWRSSSGQLDDKERAIQQFNAFLNGTMPQLRWQVPFTPSRRLYHRAAWEANDPLVHYMAEDLTEPIEFPSTNVIARPLEGSEVAIAQFIQNDSFLGRIGKRYRPWGGNPNQETANDGTAYTTTMKDPLVRTSDDWAFPTNTFPNLGWMGRVHRGTPWQTIYLKSASDAEGRIVNLDEWSKWSGSYGTHPTNDWRLLDLFTVAPNESASRGTLGVNQTNIAAWSAVLSGVLVKTNISLGLSPSSRPQTDNYVIQPYSAQSPQILSIVAGINRARAAHPKGAFQTLGDVLAAPELTVRSPFLNLSGRQRQEGYDDATCEAIPQQILSLLRTDEPRVVVYAFGQSLKPAERSLVTVGTMSPPIFNLCTNYQVTGEFAAKTVFRLDELPPALFSGNPPPPAAQKLQATIENYTVLQPQ